MSAYSIAGLIFAPILGKVTDHVGKAKMTVIFGNLCSIGGSLIYCAVRNKYGIASARFVSGIGMALDGSIIGTLSRTTDPANKSRLVGIMLLCRQLGVMLGLGCSCLFNEVMFVLFWNSLNKSILVQRIT